MPTIDRPLCEYGGVGGCARPATYVVCFQGSLVAFVRLSRGALEERLLDRKAPRLETRTRSLGGGVTGLRNVTAAPHCVPSLELRRYSLTLIG